MLGHLRVLLMMVEMTAAWKVMGSRTAWHLASLSKLDSLMDAHLAVKMVVMMADWIERVQ